MAHNSSLSSRCWRTRVCGLVLARAFFQCTHSRVPLHKLFDDPLQLAHYLVKARTNSRLLRPAPSNQPRVALRCVFGDLRALTMLFTRVIGVGWKGAPRITIMPKAYTSAGLPYSLCANTSGAAHSGLMFAMASSVFVATCSTSSLQRAQESPTLARGVGSLSSST
jgi:hypothetical protein